MSGNKDAKIKIMINKGFNLKNNKIKAINKAAAK